LWGEGKRIFESLRVPSGWQVEIYFQRERSREFAWSAGRPDDTVSSWSQGMGVRAVHRGRQGFASACEISSGAARRLWDQARAAAAFSPADARRTFYAPRPGEDEPAAEPGDDDLFRGSPGEVRDRLAFWEKRALAKDRRLKKVLKLSLSETRGESALFSSMGVAVREPYGDASFSAEVLGEWKKDVQVGWDWSASRSRQSLDVERVLAGACGQAVGAFGAKALFSGTWPVVFHPKAGVEFLELLSDALGADAVQHGRSFFVGRRGKRVGSSAVTLVDDGRYPGGLATARFDDEGCPTRETATVSGGVLREFLYDHYTARKENRLSTGNGNRSGVDGPPSPSASNFYLKPGGVPAAELMRDTARAFVVEDVIGMHMADGVSGDFSVGAGGFLWRNGRRVHAVRGATLAGNLLEMLNGVDAVADDLTWYGAVGAPTFRVKGLSVGGA